jgi:MYXO-CTERM domain-containing protein
MHRALVVVGVSLAAAVAAPPAHADTRHGGQLVEVAGPDGVVRHADLILPTEAFTALGDPISPVIFMNRCRGGCTITSAARDDARTQQSTIPNAPDGTQIAFPAFPFSDAVWDQFMACAREVYSPYNVTVTDVDPGASVVHHEVIVAGTPDLVGLGPTILGIAPVASDCLAKNNNISYDFAANHSPDDVLELCATATHESAHSWGLDHEYDCTDPMTYLTGCGQKFFRNRAIECGEFDGPRACRCGPAQNSHAMILGVFGPGQSTVPPPAVEVISPKDADLVTSGFAVFVSAAGKRGVARLEVWVNGYKWATLTPTDIHASGPFTIAMPTNLPDGVMDLEARAYDDLELYSTTTITVTKGAPCASATTCATGQACDAGRCHWDAPDKQLGDACSFPQECTSSICQDLGAGPVCTHACFTGIAGECPASFECLATGGASGFCLDGTSAPAGCCSAGDASASEVAMHLGLIGLVGAIAFRRRRRR